MDTTLIGTVYITKKSHPFFWLLIYSNLAITKNARKQTKSIFVLYPKWRADTKMLHGQDNMLTDEEIVIIREVSQTCMLFTCDMKILWNSDNEASMK